MATRKCMKFSSLPSANHTQLPSLPPPLRRCVFYTLLLGCGSVFVTHPLHLCFISVVGNSCEEGADT